MITATEALDIVLQNQIPSKLLNVDLEDAQGYILAESIVADRDFPPYNRITMDGIAISYAAYEAGNRSFPITGIAPAGTAQNSIGHQDECMEVMTGAILPKGTDTVIRYEDLVIEDGQATIQDVYIKKRQNIHFQGLDRKQGSVILQSGTRISGPELSILATVGKSKVEVYAPPRVAIITSGDELVDVSDVPEAYQIRKSNNIAIRSAIAEFRCEVNNFHVPDEPKAIESELRQILANHDMLILSGGVSKGKFDFIPQVLETLEVDKLFHKVLQRPGKPFWFGRQGESKVVFALPGNPVSSFMCCNRYVKSWIRKYLNIETKPTFAQLTHPITFKPDLTYFAQVSISSNSEGTLIATPIEGNGSGDFANLSDADAFMIIPRGKDVFEAGETYEVLFYKT